MRYTNKDMNNIPYWIEISIEYFDKKNLEDFK
jgi:hypothetical protein